MTRLTDEQRIDLLPALLWRLHGKYAWSHATPMLTRAAIDLEWNSLSKFQRRAALTPTNGEGQPHDD